MGNQGDYLFNPDGSASSVRVLSPKMNLAGSQWAPDLA